MKNIDVRYGGNGTAYNIFMSQDLTEATGLHSLHTRALPDSTFLGKGMYPSVVQGMLTRTQGTNWSAKPRANKNKLIESNKAGAAGQTAPRAQTARQSFASLLDTPCRRWQNGKEVH